MRKKKRHSKHSVCKFLLKAWCSEHGQPYFDTRLNGAVLHRPSGHPVEKPPFGADSAGNPGNHYLFFAQTPFPLSPQRTQRRKRFRLAFLSGQNPARGKTVLLEIKIRRPGDTVSKKEVFEEKATRFPGH